MAFSTKEEKSIAFGLKSVYVTVALAMLAGGAAWGTLKTEAGETSKAANRNSSQIERLTDKLSELSNTQAKIDERTKRIESEQREVQSDIKLLLQRLSPASSGDRLR